MTRSHRDTFQLVLTVASAAIGLVSTTVGCTPATPDSPTAQGGTSGTSSGGTASSGGSAAAGGSTGTASSSGGSPIAGGSSSGGSPVAGGSSGSAGSAGSNGAEGAGSGGGGGSDAGSVGSGEAQDAGNSPASAADGSTGTTGSSSGASGGAEGGSGQAADAAVASGDGGCNWIQNADGTWAFDPASPDKVVLFDGTSLDNWHKENEPTTPVQWTLNNDGTMTVVPSGTGVATLIQSNQKFDNLCVHVEYMTPMYPSSVTGQQRGNSGVYLKSAYEMQILDSYGDPPDINTCGAVYSIMKPLVVACHMQLIWNTYEIEFKSSVWNSANPPVKTQNAEYVKVALNGQIVQLDVPLNPAAGYTPAGIPDAPGPQPLGLQDHLCYVSFRNIWVRTPNY
jgi:3-keto-disaccharide hydrolase